MTVWLQGQPAVNYLRGGIAGTLAGIGGAPAAGWLTRAGIGGGPFGFPDGGACSGVFTCSRFGDDGTELGLLVFWA